MTWVEEGKARAADSSEMEGPRTRTWVNARDIVKEGG